MSRHRENGGIERLFKRYTRLLLCIFVIPIIFLALGGAFYFEPYWGPLTRMGGYLENDYGWNQPQEVFETPLFTIVNSVAAYDKYYDVVVIGDSFSHDIKRSWQNYFVKEAGLSVITIHHDIGLESVIRSETFQKHPPSYLVFESLEQFALPRLASYQTLVPLELHIDSSDDAMVNRASAFLNVLPRNYMRAELPTYGSDTLTPLDTRVGQFLDFLIHAVVRRLKSPPSSYDLRALWGSGNTANWSSFPAYRLPLGPSAAGLFSSVEQKHTLVFGFDLAMDTRDSLVRQAGEGAWRMKKSIEANGRTKVLTMIFPDKLTVYAPYLADPSIAPPSIIPPLVKAFPEQVRLDEVFAQAVASGIQDLYLSNDTHCGYKGYKIAAEQLLRAIETQGK